VKIRCATSNKGKLAEFRLAARVLGDGVCEVEYLEGIPPPQETGSSFEENAVEKAVYYSRFSEQMVFADDSGLVADALGGEPGIHSARYSGENATAAGNNAVLLKNMAGAENRRARFVCVVALAAGGKLLATFHGVIEGELLDCARGTQGFGYDPLFYFPPLGLTLAEIGEEEKLAVSHRGKALAAMFTYLRDTASRQAGPSSSSHP
jgi:XTP/dITP diphosphohydrolase